LRHLRLADRDLGTLAAGRPSPGTLGELRKAQLSRHLLLLSEILRTETPLWYAGSPSRHILADPATGLYAATAIATMRSGGRPPDRASLVGDAPIVAMTCEDLTLRVRLEDADPLRDRLGLPPTGRLTPAEIAHWQRMLSESWQLLVRRHRPAAEILAEVLRVIVPVQPDPAADAVSATSAHAYGAVAMSAPTDPVALSVGLLHETAHSLLNAATLLFDLVRPSRTLGYSPWRDDPRPATGILHGAYAYLAVTRFWRTEARLSGSRRAQFEFARWRAAVAVAADSLLVANRTDSPSLTLSTGAPHDLQIPTTIETGGGPQRKGDVGDESVLTAAGLRFVGALRDEVGRWLGEPVDDEVARLAGGANLDHRVRWRLRNLRVPPETTHALVSAWNDGLPRPALAEAEVVAGARRLEVSGRLALVHEWLRADETQRGPLRNGVGDGAGPRNNTGDDARPHDSTSDNAQPREDTRPPDSGVWSGSDVGPGGGGGDQRLRPGGGVRPGDDAWLGGEYGAGRESYVLALENAGGTAPLSEIDAALAGLALVWEQPALRERPEVVRAVWLAGRRPGIEALVEWLSGG
jgi:HEXXH motif-containing protein